MKPDRRYLLFSDYLRERFGDRLQKVTLTGGLVCPDPEGPELCGYCRQARLDDPAWGRGAPAHEQIRRGANFSRRHGHGSARLHVTIPNHQLTEPALDHVRATLDVIGQAPDVAVITYWTRAEWATPKLTGLLSDYAADEREIWLEIDDAPPEWPIDRPEALHYGVQVDLGVGPGGGGSNEASAAERVAKLIHELKPDAVGIKAPAVLAGTDEAELYEAGRLDDVELDEFALRAADFLERIPGDVVVHPLVLNASGDSIVGPRWVLNRQKVEEAVSLALEARGAVQGAKA